MIKELNLKNQEYSSELVCRVKNSLWLFHNLLSFLFSILFTYFLSQSSPPPVLLSVRQPLWIPLQNDFTSGNSAQIECISISPSMDNIRLAYNFSRRTGLYSAAHMGNIHASNISLQMANIRCSTERTSHPRVAERASVVGNGRNKELTCSCASACFPVPTLPDACCILGLWSVTILPNCHINITSRG